MGREEGQRDPLQARGPTGVPCRTMSYTWGTKRPGILISKEKASNCMAIRVTTKVPRDELGLLANVQWEG